MLCLLCFVALVQEAALMMYQTLLSLAAHSLMEICMCIKHNGCNAYRNVTVCVKCIEHNGCNAYRNVTVCKVHRA